MKATRCAWQKHTCMTFIHEFQIERTVSSFDCLYSDRIGSERLTGAITMERMSYAYLCFGALGSSKLFSTSLLELSSMRRQPALSMSLSCICYIYYNLFKIMVELALIVFGCFPTFPNFYACVQSARQKDGKWFHHKKMFVAPI